MTWTRPANWSAPLRILPSWDCQDGRHDIWKVRRLHDPFVTRPVVYQGECSRCGAVITSSEPIALTPKVVALAPTEAMMSVDPARLPKWRPVVRITPLDAKTEENPK